MTFKQTFRLSLFVLNKA